MKTGIQFIEFHERRWSRGADAARFQIHQDGEPYWIWMSKTDIKKNMLQFPYAKEELQKGLDAYQGKIRKAG